MYVIDITRTKDELDSDMLVGKDSMDAKRKTMNYISNFVFANYNINIDKDLLDESLNIDLFSLKDFMITNYNLVPDKNLIIQAKSTDKDHCLFVKFFDEDVDEYPTLYILNKKDEKKAKTIMAYIVNDELINKYKDNLSIYKENKIQFYSNIDSYSFRGIKCNVVSLYNKNGLFLEELLNNYCSLNHLNDGNLEKMHIFS